MNRKIKAIMMATFALSTLCLALRGGSQESMQMAPGMHHDHGAAGAPLSFAELQTTVAQLILARKATEKYQDVNIALADGYVAVGPYVPGMGFHYIKDDGPRGFNIEHPPILLYEKDPAAARQLRLVGVSYLLNAPVGSDGQPTSAPFPRALASWHKHANICVFPDHSVSSNLDAARCEQRGGQFNAETQWMIHAWIWKDSPTGVFSPTNPEVH
jgi:hypothetical protein